MLNFCWPLYVFFYYLFYQMINIKTNVVYSLKLFINFVYSLIIFINVNRFLIWP